MDGPPNLTCQDSTRQHAVDGCPLSCKQQVGGSGPPASSQNRRSQACALAYGFPVLGIRRLPLGVYWSRRLRGVGQHAEEFGKRRA